MTEIPEHLLNRSKARRAGGSGDAAAAPAASSNAPAKAESAPAKAAAAPVAKVKKPDPVVVSNAKARKKIPFWAMAGLSMLPLWLFVYMAALKPQVKVVQGPLSVGAGVYSNCAGCHGAEGAGGAGRTLYQGEVLKTFPKIEDMLNFVYNGSQRFAQAGLKVYGNPNRAGGAHAPLSYNGNPMPMQGMKAGGGLTDAQILAVVCHERYDIAGADPTSEMWKNEYTTWCSPTSPIWLALEAGSTSFDTVDKDFASLANKPGLVGTTPRASIGK